MKKMLAVLTVVALLGFGAMAFAQSGGYGMMGYGGGGYGNMMGYGGGGYGMMGWGSDGQYDKETSEFLDKTADLRKAFNEKRFEYMEAWRSGDKDKAEAISKELDALSDKIRAAAPADRTSGRNGYCW